MKKPKFNILAICNKALAEEAYDTCTVCGKDMDEMEHNYGLDDKLVCIHCFTDAQEFESI